SGADRAFAAALEEAAAPDTPAVTGGGRSSAQTSSGEPIMINTFARYRITDPLEFMKTLRTIDAANQRLEGIMNDATRGVLGNSTLRQLLSEDRTRIMADIRTRVNRTITEGQLGIEIIDIRIVRADLTTDLRQSTVRRMISELQERATQTRAMGAEKAQEIRATAEKEREILLAEARRDAQILRGEGDKEAIGIYATAFNKDKDFYGFTRSLEAYRETMANPETRLILSPDSSFFKHFGNSR
ncbi:MAG: protease modulator HflC, partial [Alphaproteobacteria bacterium]|nr:protease modulator HflC [Alphaproteobacteria bacterium]